MPKKFKEENTKATGPKAQKAAAAASKEAQKKAVIEAKESEEWEKGAKGGNKAAEAAAKKAEAAAKKAERERLLAEEEKALPSKPKPENKIAAKKAAKVDAFARELETAQEPTLSASNIDDALDALALTSGPRDKASLGAQAGMIEKHPERRFKAAYAAYEEREMPNMRRDYPGLRLQQYKDRLFDQFKKSPENPFNQVSVSYDATKEDKLETLSKRNEDLEKRLAGKH